MLDNVLRSRWLRISVFTLLALIILLAVFWFGMVIGEKRADFKNNWGQNYGRFFGEPRHGFFGELPSGGPGNPFGNAGTVLSVQGDTIVTKSSDNSEKTILVTSSTVIREQSEAEALSEIKPGDLIVAIGAPNASGQIEASFIRIFPAPPNGSLPPKQ
ncbi:MAG: hypothetical protein ABSF47_00435 [Minisyncoccia bacterium]|jgi:preprotein translocase subunit YajC